MPYSLPSALNEKKSTFFSHDRLAVPLHDKLYLSIHVLRHLKELEVMAKCSNEDISRMKSGASWYLVSIRSSNSGRNSDKP